MSKFAVVYWSGTGNTETMANEVAEGIKAKGGEAEVLGAGEFTESDVAQYDGFAFGCSAQGAEVLEDSEFQPMWDAVKSSLSGKKVVLFGSYGWGGGEFAETWKSECDSLGIPVEKVFTCQEGPDETALQECKDLGESLVG